jgi:hypothetical protein
MIGGFILGAGQADGHVVVRAIGPSLAGAGITNPLLDPVLELHDGTGALVRTNDDWRETGQAGVFEGLGVAPGDDRESAIVATLGPGNYTAIVSGKAGATGVGLIEVYHIDRP